MQCPSQIVPIRPQCPDVLWNDLAQKIRDDLNSLYWQPGRTIDFARDLHRFLTDYTTEARCLAHVLDLLRGYQKFRLRWNALGGSSLNMIWLGRFHSIISDPVSPTDVDVGDIREALFWILWDQAARASPMSDSVKIDPIVRGLIELEFNWNPWDHVPGAVRDRISSYQSSQIASGTYESEACQVPQQYMLASSVYFPPTIYSVGSCEASGTQGTSIFRHSHYVDWNSSFRRVGDLVFEDTGSGARYTGPPTVLEPPVELL
jgi:hypothetical protein